MPPSPAKEFASSGRRSFSPYDDTKHHPVCSVKGEGIGLSWLGEPAIAIDRHGWIVDANAEMERLLGKDIRIQNCRLRLSDAEARSGLERVIEAMEIAQLTSEIEPIVIERDESWPVVLRVIVIPENAQAFLSDATAILMFIALGDRPLPSARLLSRIFRLTPAEARLTSQLASGRTLAAAARSLNISWETARTQLKTVFSKTNTHRQSELVALLSSLVVM